MALEEAPAGVQPVVGLVATERERRDDRQQREHEAEVEDEEQNEVADRPQSGSDDRCDRGEVGKRRRQLDSGDRRAEQPARAPVRVKRRRLPGGGGGRGGPPHGGGGGRRPPPPA